MTIDIKQHIERVRIYELDHEPDRWTAIQMREVSALADAAQASIALDLLQEHLEAGATIQHRAGMWDLFDARGEGVAMGESLRGMVINLISTDC